MTPSFKYRNLILRFCFVTLPLIAFGLQGKCQALTVSPEITYAENELLLKSHLLTTTNGKQHNLTPIYATGFIVRKKTRYFLVTNKHVLTGREPFTDRQVLQKPDSVQVALWTNKQSKYKIQQFALYDNDKPIYRLLTPNFDIAIMPIELDSIYASINQFIDFNQLDSRKKIRSGQDMLIVYFSNDCLITDSSGPCVTRTKLLPSLSIEPYSQLLAYNTKMPKGSSGSPIYFWDDIARTFKIAGVNFMLNIFDYDHSSLGVKGKYVKKLIRRLE